MSVDPKEFSRFSLRDPQFRFGPSGNAIKCKSDLRDRRSMRGPAQYWLPCSHPADSTPPLSSWEREATT